MTTAAPERSRSGGSGARASTFLALAALTVAELRVAGIGSASTGPGRATALTGLLIVKIGLVLAFCLRADFRRRSATRLLLVALILAAGAAAVPMLEAAFQARVR